ncbi:MAG: efflux RND transporter periplasmic adaptor subunit [Planctomycetes bacterium]|nr:efflux RND transporter periplasmic adaptor subunit [Planctomycetota bacterium]
MGRFLRKLAPFVGVLAVIALLLGGLGIVLLYSLGARPEASASIEKVHAQEGFPVEVATVGRMDFEDYLRCDGAVVADVRAKLRAKVAEVVEAVHVRVGQPVQKGQLLVELRRTDLKAQVKAAQAAYQEAKSNFGRYKTLLDQKVVTEDRFEQVRTGMENAAAALRRATSNLAFAEVRSPIDGVVASRDVEPGEFKGVGKEMLTIVDLATVEVRALVPEDAVGGLTPGLGAEFQIESGALWLPATVSRIAPSTQDPNHFFDVYLKANNEREGEKWLIRPGMYAEVRFLRESVKDGIALPETAVVNEGEGYRVFVVHDAVEEVAVAPERAVDEGGNSFLSRLRRGARVLVGSRKEEAARPGRTRRVKVEKVKAVTVKTGLRRSGFVQIKEGALRAGDRVALRPHQDLDDGARVRVIGEEE